MGYVPPNPPIQSYIKCSYCGKNPCQCGAEDYDISKDDNFVGYWRGEKIGISMADAMQRFNNATDTDCAIFGIDYGFWGAST